jgi:hypothetical protein
VASKVNAPSAIRRLFVRHRPYQRKPAATILRRRRTQFVQQRGQHLRRRSLLVAGSNCPRVIEDAGQYTRDLSNAGASPGQICVVGLDDCLNRQGCYRR